MHLLCCCLSQPTLIGHCKQLFDHTPANFCYLFLLRSPGVLAVSVVVPTSLASSVVHHKEQVFVPLYTVQILHWVTLTIATWASRSLSVGSLRHITDSVFLLKQLKDWERRSMKQFRREDCRLMSKCIIVWWMLWEQRAKELLIATLLTASSASSGSNSTRRLP